MIEHEGIARVHPDPILARDLGPELVPIFMTGITCSGNVDTSGCVVNINTGQPQDMTVAGTWDARTAENSSAATEGPVIARWAPVVTNAGMVPLVQINPFSHFNVEIRPSRKEACIMADLRDDVTLPSGWYMRARAHESGKWAEQSKTTKLILNNRQSFIAVLKRLCTADA
jgi:hypothetical protein